MDCDYSGATHQLVNWIGRVYSALRRGENRAHGNSSPLSSCCTSLRGEQKITKISRLGFCERHESTPGQSRAN